MSYNIPNFSSANFIRSNDINGTTAGIININTTNISGRFIPLFVIIEATNVSGFVTPPTITIGTTAGLNVDILVSNALTGVSLTGETIHFSTVTPSTSIPSSTGINVNILTGAVATTYTMTITLIGIYNY